MESSGCILFKKAEPFTVMVQYVVLRHQFFQIHYSQQNSFYPKPTIMTRYIVLSAAICCSFFIPAALRGQNVGIGTTTPAAKLDIIGSLKITNGTQGANKVLTSDTAGLATWSTLPTTPPACFFFATDQSVGNNTFLGLGTNSSTFIRNTIVVPVNCELSSIVFSTRAAVSNQQITARVWRQQVNGIAVATTLFATITDGFVSYTGVSNGSIPLMQGDLISVQLSWQTGGSLANGAAVSVTYK
jgi:hypothetical protein